MKEMIPAITKSKIFRDKYTLDPSYIPKILPERQKELKSILWKLRDCLNGIPPNNFFIYGKTGVGKTACIKKALQLLNMRLNELNIKNTRTMYLNCASAHSECRVVAEIANFFSKKLLAPKKGWATIDYYNCFARTLDELSGIFIIILDEIDKLIPRSKNLLYNLAGANEHHLSNARLSIVGISNDLKFTEHLDSRTLSRLCQRKMIIPPYNAEQLTKILMQRVKIAFQDVLEKGALTLCAALAAQEHGDARKALDLLKAAGEIAETEGAEKVAEKHVRSAQKDIELDETKEVINTLPTQSKLVLLSIIFNEENGRKNTTGEVYSTYKNLAKTAQTKIVTERRVSDLISELDMLGLVTARAVFYGRYGKTREVSSALPESALTILFSDEILGRVKNKFPHKGVLEKTS